MFYRGVDRESFECRRDYRFIQGIVVSLIMLIRSSMNELDKMQDFLFYNSDDGSVKVQVLVDSESETIWATQKAMAELFGVTVPNISYHLKNIFHSGELSNETVIKEILITAQNGVRGLSEGKIKYYNRDVIISVGY